MHTSPSRDASSTVDMAKRSSRRDSGLRRTLTPALLSGILLLAGACSRPPSIDVDDGQVDPGWPAVPFVTDPSDDAALELPEVDQEFTATGDILLAWVLASDSGNRMFLRLQTRGEGDVTVGVQMDCDRDGSFGDSSDVFTTYDSSLDQLEFGSGGRRILQADRPSSSGERIGTDFEWSLGPDLGLEELNWEACLAEADVRFYTFGLSSRIDETDVVHWIRSNSPP